jgi:hypothetical protein
MWNTERAAFAEIAAHWWQEDLVRAVGALVLVTLIAGFVLLYNRGLRTRQRNLRGEVARRTAQLQAANRRLTELSYQDPLTGVANRRRLMEVIDDVDNFKEYNDQYGTAETRPWCRRLPCRALPANRIWSRVSAARSSPA